jgi:hypothetical protein
MRARYSFNRWTSGYIGDDENCGAFKFWSEDKTHHIAYAFADGDGGIALAVRVFDIYAAVVSIIRDAARYITGKDTNAVLRFLTINR